MRNHRALSHLHETVLFMMQVNCFIANCVFELPHLKLEFLWLYANNHLQILCGSHTYMIEKHLE